MVSSQTSTTRIPSSTRLTMASSDSSQLLIDTQQSSIESRYDDETHESIVINLNPNVFKSDDENRQPVSVNREQSLVTGLPVFTLNFPKVVQKKTYPKQLAFERILSHVTFVMSGFENPRRSKIRDMALKMGAKYRTKWDRSCTHLIFDPKTIHNLASKSVIPLPRCAFKNTSKYKEVMARRGRVVREHWIQECYGQQQLVDWRDYKLGRYPCPDSEEEVDVTDLDYALERASRVKPAGME